MVTFTINLIDMNYSEAKEVLAKQEAAKAALEQYKKLTDAHKRYGFKTRREFVRALQELDSGPGAGRRRKSPGGRGLSDDAIKRIKSLKAEGRSNAEISRLTKVSPLTVAKYVKGGRAGKKTRTKKAAAPKKRAAAKKRTAAKKTTAAKPAAGKTTRRRVARRKAGKGRGRGLPAKTVNQIKTMKAEGKSNAEISRVTKASPITVAKYVKSTVA